jgi:spermidine/putrescine transport system permease protein
VAAFPDLTATAEHARRVGGLTYNFLPFMILPIYVSLEKIDRRLTEAAQDLYCNSRQAFLKVVLPLSLPGVFAGSLLTFIPATGDFINAELLGSPNQRMIGTVIQGQFCGCRLHSRRRCRSC